MRYKLWGLERLGFTFEIEPRKWESSLLSLLSPDPPFLACAWTGSPSCCSTLPDFTNRYVLTYINIDIHTSLFVYTVLSANCELQSSIGIYSTIYEWLFILNWRLHAISYSLSVRVHALQYSTVQHVYRPGTVCFTLHHRTKVKKFYSSLREPARTSGRQIWKRHADPKTLKPLRQNDVLFFITLVEPSRPCLLLQRRLVRAYRLMSIGLQCVRACSNVEKMARKGKGLGPNM
jgi:hypothetical protein